MRRLMWGTHLRQQSRITAKNPTMLTTVNYYITTHKSNEAPNKVRVHSSARKSPIIKTGAIFIELLCYFIASHFRECVTTQRCARVEVMNNLDCPVAHLLGVANLLNIIRHVLTFSEIHKICRIECIRCVLCWLSKRG